MITAAVVLATVGLCSFAGTLWVVGWFASELAAA